MYLSFAFRYILSFYLCLRKYIETNLEDRLNKREIKPTAMRILILQYLMKQKSATSLQQIENAMPSADKSTIYRTLKTFENNRLIHAVDDGT